MSKYLYIASDLVAVILKHVTLLRISVCESYEYNQEIVLFSIKLTSIWLFKDVGLCPLRLSNKHRKDCHV